ncbi:MAG: hypothetical protein LAT68_04905 [Cyclobacteriaceae bacterium]|nr:hypothetical protein [Cyclobacteriaceae bacterium]MCH8515651.1 hypothetical protein [Cyclobacteriaceae bacterium]
MENSGKNLDSYRNKKEIPHSIEQATLKALSFYPDLKETKIEFKFNEDIKKSVMQAQPKFTSMWRSRKNRSYIIKISKYFELKGEKTPIEDLPEDVLVGWIGHELGHISDYLTKNNFTLIAFGILYLTSPSFIMSAERVADSYAVDHGLGEYILKTKDFILNQAGMPQKYLDKINRLYVPPEEIMALMENRSSHDD